MEMIVWGGEGEFSVLDTGGRYDPSTDTWMATSTGPGVPSARYGAAVWTGTEMIIWGGSDGPSLFNTGGRYGPSTDTWEATSTGAGVPSARRGNSAAWTGREMIVWGGVAGGASLFNTGGRYDPSTDTWAATSTGGAGAPSARIGHTAAWTGEEMIVWGGIDGSLRPSNTGGRYDPTSDTWSPTPTGATVPSARAGHTAVWTGTEMIVWGGTGLSWLNTGGRYDPSMDTWIATSKGADVPSARAGHTAVWTGTEMIVWGGNPILTHGGVYCAFAGCTVSPSVCDDGDACTLDSCDPGTNECVSEPVVCDSEGVCSIGTCDPTAGCVYISHDADGDAVCDDADECPESDLAPTVMIHGCDSHMSNDLLSDGCTIADHISACAAGARNHGSFVSCVARVTSDLRADGVLTGGQRSNIQTCAARSNPNPTSPGIGAASERHRSR